MDRMLYVRLDFGSGGFLHPRGSNFYAEFEKWVRMGRIFRMLWEIIHLGKRVRYLAIPFFNDNEKN